MDALTLAQTLITVLNQKKTESSLKGEVSKILNESPINQTEKIGDKKARVYVYHNSQVAIVSIDGNCTGYLFETEADKNKDYDFVLDAVFPDGAKRPIGGYSAERVVREGLAAESPTESDLGGNEGHSGGEVEASHPVRRNPPIPGLSKMISFDKYNFHENYKKIMKYILDKNYCGKFPVPDLPSRFDYETKSIYHMAFNMGFISKSLYSNEELREFNFNVLRLFFYAITDGSIRSMKFVQKDPDSNAGYMSFLLDKDIKFTSYNVVDPLADEESPSSHDVMKNFSINYARDVMTQYAFHKKINKFKETTGGIEYRFEVFEMAYDSFVPFIIYEESSGNITLDSINKDLRNILNCYYTICLAAVANSMKISSPTANDLLTYVSKFGNVKEDNKISKSKDKETVTEKPIPVADKKEKKEEILPTSHGSLYYEYDKKAHEFYNSVYYGYASSSKSDIEILEDAAYMSDPKVMPKLSVIYSFVKNVLFLGKDKITAKDAAYSIAKYFNMGYIENKPPYENEYKINIGNSGIPGIGYILIKDDGYVRIRISDTLPSQCSNLNLRSLIAVLNLFNINPDSSMKSGYKINEMTHGSYFEKYITKVSLTNLTSFNVIGLSAIYQNFDPKGSNEITFNDLAEAYSTAHPYETENNFFPIDELVNYLLRYDESAAFFAPFKDINMRLNASVAMSIMYLIALFSIIEVKASIYLDPDNDKLGIKVLELRDKLLSVKDKDDVISLFSAFIPKPVVDTSKPATSKSVDTPASTGLPAGVKEFPTITPETYGQDEVKLKGTINIYYRAVSGQYFIFGQTSEIKNEIVNYLSSSLGTVINYEPKAIYNPKLIKFAKYIGGYRFVSKKTEMDTKKILKSFVEDCLKKNLKVNIYGMYLFEPLSSIKYATPSGTNEEKLDTVDKVLKHIDDEFKSWAKASIEKHAGSIKDNPFILEKIYSSKTNDGNTVIPDEDKDCIFISARLDPSMSVKEPALIYKSLDIGFVFKIGNSTNKIVSILFNGLDLTESKTIKHIVDIDKTPSDIGDENKNIVYKFQWALFAIFNNIAVYYNEKKSYFSSAIDYALQKNLKKKLTLSGFTLKSEILGEFYKKINISADKSKTVGIQALTSVNQNYLEDYFIAISVEDPKTGDALEAETVTFKTFTIATSPYIENLSSLLIREVYKHRFYKKSDVAKFGDMIKLINEKIYEIALGGVKSESKSETVKIDTSMFNKSNIKATILSNKDKIGSDVETGISNIGLTNIGFEIKDIKIFNEQSTEYSLGIQSFVDINEYKFNTMVFLNVDNDGSGDSTVSSLLFNGNEINKMLPPEKISKIYKKISDDIVDGKYNNKTSNIIKFLPEVFYNFINMFFISHGILANLDSYQNFIVDEFTYGIEKLFHKLNYKINNKNNSYATGSYKNNMYIDFNITTDKGNDADIEFCLEFKSPIELIKKNFVSLNMTVQNFNGKSVASTDIAESKIDIIPIMGIEPNHLVHKFGIDQEVALGLAPTSIYGSDILKNIKASMLILGENPAFKKAKTESVAADKPKETIDNYLKYNMGKIGYFLSCLLFTTTSSHTDVTIKNAIFRGSKAIESRIFLDGEDNLTISIDGDETYICKYNDIKTEEIKPIQLAYIHAFINMLGLYQNSTMYTKYIPIGNGRYEFYANKNSILGLPITNGEVIDTEPFDELEKLGIDLLDELACINAQFVSFFKFSLYYGKLKDHFKGEVYDRALIVKLKRFASNSTKEPMLNDDSINYFLLMDSAGKPYDANFLSSFSDEILKMVVISDIAQSIRSFISVEYLKWGYSTDITMKSNLKSQNFTPYIDDGIYIAAGVSKEIVSNAKNHIDTICWHLNLGSDFTASKINNFAVSIKYKTMKMNGINAVFNNEKSFYAFGPISKGMSLHMQDRCYPFPKFLKDLTSDKNTVKFRKEISNTIRAIIAINNYDRIVWFEDNGIMGIMGSGGTEEGSPIDYHSVDDLIKVGMVENYLNKVRDTSFFKSAKGWIGFIINSIEYRLSWSGKSKKLSFLFENKSTGWNQVSDCYVDFDEISKNGMGEAFLFIVFNQIIHKISTINKASLTYGVNHISIDSILNNFNFFTKYVPNTAPAVSPPLTSALPPVISPPVVSPPVITPVIVPPPVSPPVPPVSSISTTFDMDKYPDYDYNSGGKNPIKPFKGYEYGGSKEVAKRLVFVKSKSGGTLSGGIYKDSATDIKYFVKFHSDVNFLKDEIFANHLYRYFGINALDARLVTVDGKVAIITPYLENLKMFDASNLPEGALMEFAKQCPVDMLLGNYDCAGTSFDNVGYVINDKGRAEIIRIDTGASLFYRADGSLKGNSKYKPFSIDAKEAFNWLYETATESHIKNFQKMFSYAKKYPGLFMKSFAKKLEYYKAEYIVKLIDWIGFDFSVKLNSGETIIDAMNTTSPKLSSSLKYVFPKLLKVRADGKEPAKTNVVNSNNLVELNKAEVVKAGANSMPPISSVSSGSGAAKVKPKQFTDIDGTLLNDIAIPTALTSPMMPTASSIVLPVSSPVVIDISEIISKVNSIDFDGKFLKNYKIVSDNSKSAYRIDVKKVDEEVVKALIEINHFICEAMNLIGLPSCVAINKNSSHISSDFAILLNNNKTIAFFLRGDEIKYSDPDGTSLKFVEVPGIDKIDSVDVFAKLMKELVNLKITYDAPSAVIATAPVIPVPSSAETIISYEIAANIVGIEICNHLNAVIKDSSYTKDVKDSSGHYTFDADIEIYTDESTGSHSSRVMTINVSSNAKGIKLTSDIRDKHHHLIVADTSDMKETSIKGIGEKLIKEILKELSEKEESKIEKSIKIDKNLVDYISALKPKISASSFSDYIDSLVDANEFKKEYLKEMATYLNSKIKKLGKHFNIEVEDSNFMKIILKKEYIEQAFNIEILYSSDKCLIYTLTQNPTSTAAVTHERLIDIDIDNNKTFEDVFNAFKDVAVDAGFSSYIKSMNFDSYSSIFNDIYSIKNKYESNYEKFYSKLGKSYETKLVSQKERRKFTIERMGDKKKDVVDGTAKEQIARLNLLKHPSVVVIITDNTTALFYMKEKGDGAWILMKKLEDSDVESYEDSEELVNSNIDNIIISVIATKTDKDYGLSSEELYKKAKAFFKKQYANFFYNIQVEENKFDYKTFATDLQDYLEELSVFVSPVYEDGNGDYVINFYSKSDSSEHYDININKTIDKYFINQKQKYVASIYGFMFLLMTNPDFAYTGFSDGNLAITTTFDCNGTLLDKIVKCLNYCGFNIKASDALNKDRVYATIKTQSSGLITILVEKLGPSGSLEFRLIGTESYVVKEFRFFSSDINGDLIEMIVNMFAAINGEVAITKTSDSFKKSVELMSMLKEGPYAMKSDIIKSITINHEEYASTIGIDYNGYNDNVMMGVDYSNLEKIVIYLFSTAKNKKDMVTISDVNGAIMRNLDRVSRYISNRISELVDIKLETTKSEVKTEGDTKVNDDNSLDSFKALLNSNSITNSGSGGGGYLLLVEAISHENDRSLYFATIESNGGKDVFSSIEELDMMDPDHSKIVKLEFNDHDIASYNPSAGFTKQFKFDVILTFNDDKELFGKLILLLSTLEDFDKDSYKAMLNGLVLKHA